ncbi:MAG: hypothetical protein LBS00_11965, partial [Synergistaceae bacterium]|nr:hypothetical protein [Synergistaceae bacterium]
MQGMQNMQKTEIFSFSPSPSGQTSELKAESGEKKARGFFESFLASPTQAAEQTDRDNDVISPEFPDSTLKEYTTNLSLEGMGLFFSKPVLDLLASLKEDLGELQEKGVDIELISEQVDELLGEARDESPGVNAERLEAMLSRLRSRYEAVLTSDDSRRLDAEAVLPGLKLGLEASLRHSKDGSLRSESPENGLLGGENSQDGTAEVIENPEG